MPERQRNIINFKLKKNKIKAAAELRLEGQTAFCANYAHGVKYASNKMKYKKTKSLKSSLAIGHVVRGHERVVHPPKAVSSQVGPAAAPVCRLLEFHPAVRIVVPHKKGGHDKDFACGGIEVDGFLQKRAW